MPKASATIERSRTAYLNRIEWWRFLDLSAEGSGPFSSRGRLAYIGTKGVLIAVVGTFVLLFTRTPQTFLAPQLWAEDGAVFLVQEKLYGIKAFLIPYAGYFHLFPRLTAFVAAPFGAVYAPTLYATAAVIGTLWSAATIASVRAPFAWLFGALLMAPPHSGEIFGNLTNAQWMMAPALAFALATPTPAERWAKINQFIFMTVAGLSGPFSILAVPLCLRRLAASSRRFDWSLCGICLVTATVQCTSIVLSSKNVAAENHSSFIIALLMLDRTIGQLMHGSLTYHSFQFLLVFIGVIVIIAGVIDRKQRWPLSLIIYTLLILIGTWVKFRYQDPNLMTFLGYGDRYFFVPRLIIIWIMIDVFLRMRRVSALAALSLSVIFLNFHHWRKADLPLLEWRAEAGKIDRGEAVRIVINPSPPDSQDGWAVSLPRTIP